MSTPFHLTISLLTLSHHSGYANFRFQRGELVAREGFPADKYLLSLGTHNASKGPGGLNTAVANAGVQQMTFSANREAGGCLEIYYAQFVNVGPGRGHVWTVFE